MRVTHYVVAMTNLQAQIDGREQQISTGAAPVGDWIELIGLVTLRGQILGCISDYELAEAASEQLTRDAPTDGEAFVARAGARSKFHRFAEALADLDVAEQLGADRDRLAAERGCVFQAVGRYDEAFALYDDVAKRRTDFDSLGALAVLHADRGKTAAAEDLFNESLACYRGVSPFGPAFLDFARAQMWLVHGNRREAQKWLEAAVSLLPTYASAQGHLAEIEGELGEHDMALSRLLPLANTSDDPDYAASLARILKEVGQVREADKWWRVAATRYAELMARHPEAFADHAAEFWLAAGDVDRAAHLAKLNLGVRNTPRARELFVRVGVPRTLT